MLHWIESQSTATIACLMFGFCYSLAAAAYAGGAFLSRRSIGEEQDNGIAVSA
jgi:hypothetical protein